MRFTIFEAPLSAAKGTPHPTFLFSLGSLWFPDQICCLCLEEGSPHHPLPLRVTVSPQSQSRFSPAWASKISSLECISSYVVLVTYFNGQISSCRCSSPLGCCDDPWAEGSCCRTGAVRYLFGLWVTAVPISLSCSCADSAGLRGAKCSNI